MLVKDHYSLDQKIITDISNRISISHKDEHAKTLMVTDVKEIKKCCKGATMWRPS